MRISILLIFILLFASCANKRVNPYNSYVKDELLNRYKRAKLERRRTIASVDFDGPEFANFKLKKADSLNMSYTVESVFPVRVKFHNMTKQDYLNLHRAYKRKYARPFELGKTYFLKDFLPVPIEAMMNDQFEKKYFRPSWLVQANQSSETRLKINGNQLNYITFDHDALTGSLEVARYLFDRPHPKEFNLNYYSLDNETANNLLESEIFQKVKSPQTGDIIVLREGANKFIKHAVLYIDENLYFEKKSGEDGEYRLISKSELESRFKSNHLKLNLVTYRLTKSLPSPDNFTLKRSPASVPNSWKKVIPESEQGKYIFRMSRTNPVFGKSKPQLNLIKSARIYQNSKDGFWYIKR